MNQMLKDAIDQHYFYYQSWDANQEDIHKNAISLYKGIEESIKDNKNLNENFILEIIMYKPSNINFSLMLIDILSRNTESNSWNIQFFKKFENKLLDIDCTESIWIRNMIIEKIIKYHTDVSTKTLHYLYYSPWFYDTVKLKIEKRSNYQNISGMILKEMNELGMIYE